jgi:hypothetical protein
MASDPRQLLDFVASLVPEEARAEFRRKTVRTVLTVQKLEQLRARSRGPARERCVASYGARFGDVPPGFGQQLEAMGLPMLEATEQLVAESADADAFHRRFELLTRRTRGHKAATVAKSPLAREDALFARRRGAFARLYQQVLSIGNAYQAK